MAGLVECVPAFVSGSQGALFVVGYRPEPQSLFHHVVVLPPFAEEMNRSRRQFHLLGMALARKGIAVTVFDPFGTGDSQGEFGCASWENWQEDTQIIMDWTQANGPRSISLLGCRLGALLAADLARRAYNEVHSLVFWQPVIDGKAFLNQFLRIRLAAAMIEGKGQRSETMATLREFLTQGQSVEIGGYALSSEMAARIDGLRLGDLLGEAAPPVSWLELCNSAGGELPPSSRKEIEKLRARGLVVEATGVVGEPFWSLQEIVTVPALIEATAGSLARMLNE